MMHEPSLAEGQAHNQQSTTLKDRAKARFDAWCRAGCWRFGIKAAIALAIIIGGGGYLMDRYQIGHDYHDMTCIEGYSVFLIDRHDAALEVGNIYAFAWDGSEKVFKKGDILTKYLVAKPGDTVEVTLDEKVLVNGEQVAESLTEGRNVGLVPEDSAGRGVLGENEYWFLGDTVTSFDSRYWGAIRAEQVIGRAHGLY